MRDRNYQPPLDKLLDCGIPSTIQKWIDYPAIGLGKEHIPELIRMLTDPDLIGADPDSQQVWAPIYAWRALGQLQAIEAIEPLLEQLYRIDDEDDDWISEELPHVFSMIGPLTIPSLESYLADHDNTLFARVCAAHSLANIGNTYPDSREKCRNALTLELGRFSQNDPEMNGLLISFLVELEAIESLETIREAYQRDCVDTIVLGDLEDAEISLGVRDKRSTPTPQYGWPSEAMDQTGALIKTIQNSR